MSGKPRIPVRDNPCSSCPYRKDTPPGVWDASEYKKLPEWDDPMAAPASVFLCHHSALGSKETACRGWFEVHNDNIAVRIACATRLTINRIEPTSVPLYRSGAEACAAGMRGVARPRKPARDLIEKLTKAKSKKRA